ncbi:hypothetical protein E1295_19425 [Nonomuraea mesophila]|uniref:Uncharacterized protein n=1 Tax=Nonomuraea mesophila TaxID=2530382 RepID=A0A4R5FGW9_9ACTN|nr:hypothetical protein E1295_19425 [Nonomuraea mesophila]
MRAARRNTLRRAASRSPGGPPPRITDHGSRITDHGSRITLVTSRRPVARVCVAGPRPTRRRLTGQVTGQVIGQLTGQLTGRVTGQVERLCGQATLVAGADQVSQAAGETAP